MSLVKAVDLEISSVAFQAAHPELHHYTNAAGLKGIVSSNTIWATHFSDLNDSTEVTHLRQAFAEALAPRYEELIARQNLSEELPQLYERDGGSQKLARDFVDSLYGATFDGNSELTSMAAFITSFCTHADDQPDNRFYDRSYERENGLLSQWRSYGGADGYCIVFDTAKLSYILASEFDARYWVHMKIDPVHYAVQGASPGTEFLALLDAVAQTLTDFFNGQRTPEMGVQEFLIAASLFKHQGFREEQEVRVVAIPATEIMRSEALKHPEFQDKPVPDVHARPDGVRRYVTLLDGLGVELPIRRVIVGPSRQQTENVAFVRALLKPNIPVVPSATPWLS